jgi:hypothetical protein
MTHDQINISLSLNIVFICRLRVGSKGQQQQQQQQQTHYNHYNQQQNSFNYLNRTNIHNNALGETKTNIDGNNYAVVHITGIQDILQKHGLR